MKLPKFITKLFNRITIIGLIVLIGLFYFFLPRKKIEPLQFTKVTHGTIKSVVSASGVLAGKDSASLKFKSSGKLAYLGVKVGDNVSPGQVIASLDIQDLQITLQQAQNDLRAKQAAAEKAEDDVKDHDKDETFTQKQTRTAAQAARDSAFDSVKAGQVAINNAVINAPFAGIITVSNFLPNQIVTATDTIVQIVDFSKVYFDADIDEADISKVALNQLAEVSLNSYPEQVFQGTVAEIKPQTKTTSSGANVITARINLDNPKIHLIPGLNGQVTITSEQKDNTLFIPQEALRDNLTVLAKNNNQINPVRVKTGLKSDTDIEILEGLNAGQEIVQTPSLYMGTRSQNLFSRFFSRFTRQR